MISQLLSLIYRISSAAWIFFSGVLLAQGITVVNAVTLAPQWPSSGARTLVEGIGYVIMAAAAAAVGWEVARIEREVAVVARTGIDRTTQPHDPIAGQLPSPAQARVESDPANNVIKYHSRRLTLRLLALGLSVALVLGAYVSPLVLNGNTKPVVRHPKGIHASSLRVAQGRITLAYIL